MRTIEAIATITPDGQLTLKIPPDILPGQHRVVLVIEEQPSLEGQKRSPLKFSAYPVGLVSEHLTFRREELYSD